MSTAAPRLRSARQTLYSEQKLAIAAAIGLLLSMLLPWYQQGGFVTRPGQAPTELSDSFNAFQSWGFVEASVLLVALEIRDPALAVRSERAEAIEFRVISCAQGSPFGQIDREFVAERGFQASQQGRRGLDPCGQRGESAAGQGLQFFAQRRQRA